MEMHLCTIRFHVIITDREDSSLFLKTRASVFIKKALMWTILVRFTQSPETGCKEHANRCQPILHLSPMQPRDTESAWEGRCMQVWFAAVLDVMLLSPGNSITALHCILTEWTKGVFYLMLWKIPEVNLDSVVVYLDLNLWNDAESD